MTKTKMQADVATNEQKAQADIDMNRRKMRWKPQMEERRFESEKQLKMMEFSLKMGLEKAKLIATGGKKPPIRKPVKVSRTPRPSRPPWPDSIISPSPNPCRNSGQ